MTNSKLSPWRRAQLLEREYHVSANTAQLKDEQQKRKTYAALLGIEADRIRDKRVLDVAAGPCSLLLSFADVLSEGSIALDPLLFTKEIEQRYSDAGIIRAVEKIETYSSKQQFDEVWLYNALQHVEDLQCAFDSIRRCGSRIIRVFEYLNVPCDDMHLHQLSADILRAGFKGMNPAKEITGVIRTQGMSTDFYAALYIQRSEDAQQWL